MTAVVYIGQAVAQVHGVGSALMGIQMEGGSIDKRRFEPIRGQSLKKLIASLVLMQYIIYLGVLSIEFPGTIQHF